MNRRAPLKKKVLKCTSNPFMGKKFIMTRSSWKIYAKKEQSKTGATIKTDKFFCKFIEKQKENILEIWMFELFLITESILYQ